MVKYSVRHYAHFACYLDAGKLLSKLRTWQIKKFPYQILHVRDLLPEAERLVGLERTDENIYASASIRQSINEGLKQ